MKRSQLREIVLEAMKGYSKYAPGGETKGGTTDDFRNILTTIAKGRPEEEPKPEVMEDADKTRAEHLGTLRGSLMHVKTLLDAERPHNEILAYVEKALKQVSSSDAISEGEEKEYEVEYWYRSGDDKDYEREIVKAASEEEAIEKVKADARRGAMSGSFIIIK